MVRFRSLTKNFYGARFKSDLPISAENAWAEALYYLRVLQSHNICPQALTFDNLNYECCVEIFRYSASA